MAAQPPLPPTTTPPPRLVYLFGGPGAGKTHVGRVLAQHFGYTFYDADDWLPGDMVLALERGEAFTAEMRDRYYGIVCEKVEALLATAPQQKPMRCAVAQATYKNRHRKLIQQRFPRASLWHVSAPSTICVQRVTKTRSDRVNDDGGATSTVSTEAAALPAGSAAANTSWVLQHASGFEAPTHPCKVLVNDNDDDPDVLKGRIRKLLVDM